MSKEIEIKKSTRKGKKYMVKHNDKWIHFGALDMEHYRDSTPLKLYSSKDHNDEDRKKASGYSDETAIAEGIDAYLRAQSKK